MFIRLLPRATDAPATQLATAELLFDGREPLLCGLKLTGFAIWDTRGRRRVTVPARTYTVQGERRAFTLLRVAAGDDAGLQRLTHAILEAYAQLEASLARQTDGGTLKSIDVPVR